MDNNIVDKVLDKIVNDKEFRKKFESNRRKSLDGFKLNSTYVAALMALNVPLLMDAITTIGNRPVVPL
jgi:hypothetical protein